MIPSRTSAREVPAVEKSRASGSGTDVVDGSDGGRGTVTSGGTWAEQVSAAGPQLSTDFIGRNAGVLERGGARAKLTRAVRMKRPTCRATAERPRYDPRRRGGQGIARAVRHSACGPGRTTKGTSVRRPLAAAVAAVALVLGGFGTLPAQAASATQGTVTVKVTAPGGAPIVGAVVNIMGDVDYDEGITGTAGTYRSRGLEPGTYLIDADVEFGSGETAMSTVTISAALDSTATLTVAGVQVISGKVTIGGEALASGVVYIETIDPSAGAGTYSATVTNGTYSALVAPGRAYRVHVSDDWEKGRTS